MRSERTVCYVASMIKVDQEVLLDVRGITKSFAGVRALRGVDLQIVPGEVHCVLGQNGAGKSTLIKTLAGVHRPDDGTISWQGEVVDIPNPQAGLALGIATMYQELDVVDGLDDRREHLPRPRARARRLHEALARRTARPARC